MGMVQRDVNEKMRGILVDWIGRGAHQVQAAHGDHVSLGRHSWTRRWPPSRSSGAPQLLGITAMLIASKFEEDLCGGGRRLHLVADNAYQRDEILRCERETLDRHQVRAHLAERPPLPPPLQQGRQERQPRPHALQVPHRALAAGLQAPPVPPVPRLLQAPSTWRGASSTPPRTGTPRSSTTPDTPRRR